MLKFSWRRRTCDVIQREKRLIFNTSECVHLFLDSGVETEICDEMSVLLNIAQHQSLIFAFRLQLNSAVLVNLRCWEVLECQPENVKNITVSRSILLLTIIIFLKMSV